MKVAITGASGLVGTALTQSLEGDGHTVIPVVRRQATENEIGWDPEKGTIDADAFTDIDGVVHLAGDNIAKGRWNVAKKERILQSRVRGTQLISETLAQLAHRPSVFVSASAIGFYGDRGDELLDEASARGTGYLADVCSAWEQAAQPARDAGIRTVNVRLGVVLSPDGGALQAMLTPFKLGGGGIVGNGKQYWSWISIHDVVGVIRHALDTPDLEGPINVTAPTPSTNAQFTKALGHVLGRPTILPMPAFAARLALGEMADALLLASARVLPRKLEESGYQFKYEDLEAALRALLK